MKRNSQGYLTVEATLSLSIFLFSMMFLLNFGQIYMAQSYVTHGLLQTGKMLSFESYEYDQVSAVGLVGTLVEAFGVGQINNAQSLSIAASWKLKNYTAAVEKAFPYCAGGTPSNNEELKKRYGISSIKFNANVYDNNKLVITATYHIDLRFAFFGIKEIELRQSVKNGLWK